MASLSAETFTAFLAPTSIGPMIDSVLLDHGTRWQLWGCECLLRLHVFRVKGVSVELTCKQLVATLNPILHNNSDNAIAASEITGP